MQRVTSPQTGDSAIEAEIKAKGLTAPRITPADIEANIAGEYYFTAAKGVYGDGPWARGETGPFGEEGREPDALDLLTFCVLVLKNDFTVTGESACASPENFDAVIGRRIARQNAVQKIWPLMGYELRTKLATTQAKRAAMPSTPTGARAYCGTKDVFGTPMTRAEYNTYRGWELPADENGADEGYLVEYIDGGTSNHPAHAGYISWSPADVFSRAYKLI